MLEILLSAAETDLPISRDALLDRALEFLMKFDPVQIRYAGQGMLALLTRVGSGQLFSVSFVYMTDNVPMIRHLTFAVLACCCS